MISITSRIITSQRIATLGRFLHETPLRKSWQEEVRVRFAPSPTGHLHLGGLRTAFYNYVFARQNNGKFLLRIEDTDQTRIVPGSAETIEATLKWAGLEPDESPLRGGPSGPYVQSERLGLYKQHARRLLDEGKAYKCFCSPTRLDLLRKHQARNNEPIRYDGKCKSLTLSEIQDKSDEGYCVRFPLTSGQYSFDDLIFGQVGGNLLAIRESDPIILKTDGYPTYHFACVVDDHLMRISHVLRGSEWLSSCVKHLQLYGAFGWQPPKFAHFPLITMQDGSKMSKRNDSSRVNTWIEAGYQPDTLLNFLTQSGGGVPKTKQDSMEFWTLEQLVSGFDFNQVTCHPSSLDLNRLHVYSAREIQLMWASNPGKVLDKFKDLLKSHNLQTDMDDATLTSVIDKLIDRLTLLKDLLANEQAFIWSIPKLSFECEDFTSLGWDLPEIIAKFERVVDDVGLEDKEEFSRALKKVSKEDNLNYAKMMGFLRRILTDCDKGLPVYEICTCLGEARLRLYLQSAKKLYLYMMSVHNFEARLEERLRKKAFAHYDGHSMTVDFANPVKYRILQERRNTTTGASAASLVQQNQQPFSNKHGNQQQDNIDQSANETQSTNLHNNNNSNLSNKNNNPNGNYTKLQANYQGQQEFYKSTNETYNNVNGTTSLPNASNDSLNPSQDSGDGRQNDLVSACPFFRNEIGGEEERIVCLNKLTDRRITNTSTELHKPSFVSGVSILESASSPLKNLCPYQRNLQSNPVIDYTDTGATYYRNYFYGQEHQNWFGNSETYGPLAISIRREQIVSGKYQYRIIIRTSELAVLRGSVHEDCIPKQRTAAIKDVLEYLLARTDIQLNKLKLGLPEADSKLLKLDEHKLTKNYKIGILYCKAGQSTEEEFYNNEHSGPLFDEFLSCIGERVRLLGFDRYKGGLDNKSDSTGLYSIYSTYDDCEIMFHVSTMLPYSANNRQQLSRKRHIGNDIVTIVFQEEGALPFTPKTFRSQFQHIFIIVRALNPPILSDGSYDFSAPRHYAVAVSRSKEMPPFGPPIPEGGIFIKSPQFKNFLLAKVINAENAAHKYCGKFREMGQWTRRGLLKDLLEDCVADISLSDYYSSNSSAVKMVSSLFMGKKQNQRRYAIFCGHSEIQGAIVWDVQVKDFGQSNKIIDCILGVSATYLVLIEQQTKELLYVSPVEAILGWTSNPAWIKIFCHQAECLLVQIKDPDVDEICEIVTRLKAVTSGCETRELTLRRKNSQNSLGFDILPDGIVTRVDDGSIAWQTHLQPGSRLVEICKTSTATLSYSQMMEYIRTSAVVTLTVLPPNSDGSYRRGCLGQTCAHQPAISRPPSAFSSASSGMHFSKPKRRVPTTSLMTLV